jgi:hypothetical protein
VGMADLGIGRRGNKDPSTGIRAVPLDGHRPVERRAADVVAAENAHVPLRLYSAHKHTHTHSLNTHARTHACAKPRMHARTLTRTCTHTRARTHTHARTHAHTRAPHKCKCTCPCTCAHTQVSAGVLLLVCRCQITGCYAQTELGHGSNVRGPTLSTLIPLSTLSTLIPLCTCTSFEYQLVLLVSAGLPTAQRHNIRQRRRQDSRQPRRSTAPHSRSSLTRLR